jgi:hypothetical protein
MDDRNKMPLHRAKAKRAQIERELRKCPDFQLYLITTSARDRTRMERLLMLNPNFRLWRVLTSSIERAGSRPVVAKSAPHDGAHVQDSSDGGDYGPASEDDNESTIAPA